MLAAALLAFVPVQAVQTTGVIAPTPFDRVVELELWPDDPPLEGRGPARWIEHEVLFSGTLHVWTKSARELDLFLRVENAEGKLIAADDDSGGKPTPYVKLAVEPGLELRIAVALAKSDASVGRSDAADLELHLVAAPETATTLAEAERAKAELVEIKRLRQAGDLTAARPAVGALIERLATIEGGATSERVCDRSSAAGLEAYALALLRPTERAWRETLFHRSRTLPADHPRLQAVRGDLANTIKTLGDLAGARVLEEEVLEVFSRTLPAEHPELQRMRGNLANTIKALGDLAGAHALQEVVLEISSRTLPADHPDLQTARANLAITIQDLGDLAGARALLEQVLEVFLRTLPADHPRLQAVRGDLANTIKALGDLAGARALLEQVLEVFSRTLPADHPDLQKARQNLAIVIKMLGDLAGARALEEAVLEVRLAVLPADHPHLQAARMNLARTLGHLGDVAGARTLFEKVLEVRSRTLPEDHTDLQRARQGLALSMYALGDAAGARALIEDVLEVFSRTLPAEHPELQRTRENLAIALKHMDDLAGARAIEEAVLEVYSRTLPADHPDLQRTRRNLATTIDALGDYPGARVLFEQVLEVGSRTLPAHHRDLQQARGNFAFTLAHERVRENEETGGIPRGGGNEEFAKLAGDFIRSLAHRAHEAVLSGSSREAEERCANLSNDLGRALSFAEGLGVFGRDGSLERLAFLSSESTRGGPLLSASLARRATEHPRYAELRGEIRSVSAELARFAQGGAGADEFDRARSRRDMAERELVGLARDLLGAEAGARELDLAALSAELAEKDAIVAYRRYKRSRVEADGKDTFTDSLCAFVVRSGERLHRVELGPIEPIETAVKSWREAIGVRLERGLSKTAPESLARGEELRRLVFEPLVPAITDARRLVVALDDVLHLVPLEALPSSFPIADAEQGVTSAAAADASDGGDGALLLGDRWRIETRCTLTELLAKEGEQRSGDALVALGGASFNSEPLPLSAEDLSALEERSSEPVQMVPLLRGASWDRGFEPLTYSGPEARGIAALYTEAFDEEQPALVLEKRKASRAAMEELAPKARFLHIATHGWFAPESIRSLLDSELVDKPTGLDLRLDTEERVKGMVPMLLCGLALAGANLSEDELGRAPGLMTAEELSTLDLRNCELAVLSACDTNVGERRAGQGVASLQRALHMAGARSVITSLWKVPDEATKELMLDFYRRIWVLEEPKHEALWAAQKKLRYAVDERGEKKYTTRDWAAWVLTGSPD